MVSESEPPVQTEKDLAPAGRQIEVRIEERGSQRPSRARWGPCFPVVLSLHHRLISQRLRR